MSAQRGFFPEVGSHKPFDERCSDFFSEAGSRKPHDERSVRIFVRGDPRTTKSPRNPASILCRATHSAVNDSVKDSKGVSGFRVR